ncbi:VOC family protein [Piscibacillus salipiscarius]|uniref:VOC family protein n=1 Tax=Piscibacillus salipiscarius TaxID=299480 RepID=A0ABW5Q7K6_9BACI|nr:VOC family protein [Piscibacillus salipiscarius]
MLNQVCVMTIRVKDLEKSVYFYTEVLGFEVDQYYGDTIVSLKHSNIPIVLEEHHDLESGNNVVLAIQSENLEKDMSDLQSREVPFLLDVEPCPPGRYTIFKDPDGNHIELLEFSKVK